MKNKVYQFDKALAWINQHSVEKKGIAVNSKKMVIYPEVTGYYIPTLLQWGERELACSYARYLCEIQKADGSWYDSTDSAPYVFDSAQILKGLIAIRRLLPEVDTNIIKGCDWILSNMQENGRLTTPDKNAWGEDENFCSELIHIYCVSPIREAGKIFNRKEYEDSAQKILEYYCNEKRDAIMQFGLLSHFYAYVMEGLYDNGEEEICRAAMEKLEAYRNKRGAIPGLKDVPWTCSTGLFQLAVVWYKLGDLDKGNSLFYYALSLQNETGGWYGSYPSHGILSKLYRGRKQPFYFPDAEISWAVKYFLDALALKEKLEFEKMASSFSDEINEQDGRYLLIRERIKNKMKEVGAPIRVCDIGCGKGRYLKRISVDISENDYYVSDLSEEVMKQVEGVVEKQVCSMTNITFEDDSFEIVYVCEALEHAVNVNAAISELYRIVKPGGSLVIIDKPVEKLGQLEIYEREKWISDDDIRNFVIKNDSKLEIVKSVSYENQDDGLFRAWIISKP